MGLIPTLLVWTRNACFLRLLSGDQCVDFALEVLDLQVFTCVFASILITTPCIDGRIIGIMRLIRICVLIFQINRVTTTWLALLVRQCLDLLVMHFSHVLHGHLHFEPEGFLLLS